MPLINQLDPINIFLIQQVGISSISRCLQMKFTWKISFSFQFKLGSITIQISNFELTEYHEFYSKSCISTHCWKDIYMLELWPCIHFKFSFAQSSIEKYPWKCFDERSCKIDFVEEIQRANWKYHIMWCLSIGKLLFFCQIQISFTLFLLVCSCLFT